MKARIFSLFLVFSLLLAPVQGRTSGYLSFEYVKGQEETDVSHGSFQNPQGGLIFSENIAAKIDYVFEIRLKRENRVEIEQAGVGFNISNSINLKLGLYIVPFGKYNQSNRPHQTMLINEPLNVEKMFPSSWRDIGILAEGRVRSFFYSVYLGNGLSEKEDLRGSQQFMDNNTDKGKGGRAGLALSESLEVAYSYYRGKYDDGNQRDIVLQGVDLIWSYEGFQILSEYSRAKLENPENFLDGKVEGYFAQVSFSLDGLSPVVSYQRVKYEDPFHGVGFISPDGGEGILEEKSRWALGLVYLVSRNVFLKLEYDLNREKGLELKDNSLRIQVALSF